MDIKINITELATKLAHWGVEVFFNGNPNDIYKDNGELTEYTDKAQDIFNEEYDKHWDIIISTKIY